MSRVHVQRAVCAPHSLTPSPLYRTVTVHPFVSKPTQLLRL